MIVAVGMTIVVAVVVVETLWLAVVVVHLVDIRVCRRQAAEALEDAAEKGVVPPVHGLWEGWPLWNGTHGGTQGTERAREAERKRTRRKKGVAPLVRGLLGNGTPGMV